MRERVINQRLESRQQTHRVKGSDFTGAWSKLAASQHTVGRTETSWKPEKGQGARL